MFHTELIIGVFVGSTTVSDSVGSVAVTVRVVSGEVGEAVMVGLSAVGQSATGIMLFVVVGVTVCIMNIIIFGYIVTVRMKNEFT